MRIREDGLTKDCSPENDLTAAHDAEPPHDERSNRRSFTDEERLAFVLVSEQPGEDVVEVCRRHASLRAWYSAGASRRANAANHPDVVLISTCLISSKEPYLVINSIATESRCPNEKNLPFSFVTRPKV